MRPSSLRTAEHGEHRALADVLDRTEPEPDAFVDDGERELARVDVRRQDGHAELAALPEVHRELLGVGGLDREERGDEVARVVGLEPRRLIRQQRVGRRVRLVEAVPGEVLHQVENLGGLLLVDAVGLGAAP